MIPEKEQLDQLFHKFQAGACTEQEQQQLWQWLWLLDARQQQVLRSSEENKAIGEDMRSHILRHIQPAKRSLTRIYRYVAAAVVLLAVVSIVLIRKTMPVASTDNAVATVIRNTGDNVKIFYLPDHTRVILNRASTIEWHNDFNRAARKVQLSGEGYFEVHSDPSHPFIVVSNGIETKALATAFTIEAYRQESEVRVSLLQGKVEVSEQQQAFQPARLMPGQLLRYHTQGHQMQVEEAGNDDMLAWTRGGMTFNSIPMTEALDRLSDRYHITIRYQAAQLQHKKVSGSFHSADWQQLLPNILFIHGLHYKIQDHIVTVF